MTRKTPHKHQKLQTKMSWWSRVGKVITCHLCAYGLMFNGPLMAQEGVTGALTDTVQGISAIMQQQQQQQAAQQAAQQMQAMMQQFSPQNQMVPSKFFPQCPVLKARTDFPSGVCEAPPAPGDQAGVQSLMSVRDLANDFENEIGNLLAVNQNSPQPVGLQCLQEGMLKVETEIQDRINNLQALIDQVKKETQLFTEQNKQITDAMDLLSDELYGTKRSKADKEDFSKKFDPACNNIIGSANFTKMREEVSANGNGGLEGFFLKESAQINESASRAVNDQATVIAQIKDQLNNLDKRIQKQGLGPFVSSPDGSTIRSLLAAGGSGETFSVFDATIVNKIADLTQDFNRYKRDLDSVGFDVSLSSLDDDFKNTYGAFSKNAANYFKDEAISKCINGSDSSVGLGIDTDQIMKSIRTVGVDGNSTVLDDYRNELRGILSADGHISEKMPLIKRLDKKYGVGKVLVDYTHSGGSPVTGTVYDLYKQQIKTCESRIGQSDIYSTQNNKRVGRSRDSKIQRADKALKKILQLENDFRNDLKTALYNRAVGCEGVKYRENDCSMNSLSGQGSMLSTNSPNYCVKNAVTCGESVRACHTQLGNYIQYKKGKMNTLAARYNANISGIVAQQEQLLARIKAQVLADAEYLKTFFPGANYTYPADLFVELPAEVMSDYKINLRGGGDTTTIESLPEKLQALKTMLEEQKDGGVKEALTKYVNEQSKGMNRERKRWAALAKACAKAEEAYNQGVQQQQQQMAEQQKQQQEGNDADRRFCRRFSSMGTNPAAACGYASMLSEDMENITGAVSDDAVAQVVSLKQHCRQAQNETDYSLGEDEDEDSREEEVRSDDHPTITLLKLCEENSWNEIAESNAMELSTRDRNNIRDFYKDYDSSFSNDNKEIMENYCESFGYTLAEDNKSCDTSVENPRPNVCKHLNHLAFEEVGAATVAGNRNGFLDRLEDKDPEDIKISSNIARIASRGVLEARQQRRSPAAIASRSGTVGEELEDVPCWAQNTGEPDDGKGTFAGSVSGFGDQAGNIANIVGEALSN